MIPAVTPHGLLDCGAHRGVVVVDVDVAVAVAAARQVWQRNIRRMERIGAGHMRDLVEWCRTGDGPMPTPPA